MCGDCLKWPRYRDSLILRVQVRETVYKQGVWSIDMAKSVRTIV